MSLGKVLLVDDEPHIPMVVGRKLTAAGYEVHTASDGEEAFGLAQELHPDLIITDLQMPYMSGAELATALRESADLSKIPVILLTARGYVLPEQERGAANICQIIAKPFSVQQILEAVASLLGQSGESEAA